MTHPSTRSVLHLQTERSRASARGEIQKETDELAANEQR